MEYYSTLKRKFEMMGKVLEMYSSCCTTIWMYLRPLTCTLKMVKIVNMFYIQQEKKNWKKCIHFKYGQFVVLHLYLNKIKKKILG